MKRIGSLKKSKSGTSTVLGMLISVGILFSVVIPLFLYVNQVNNLYNRTVVERRDFDQRRLQEALTVYAYPSENQSLSVYLKNKHTFNIVVTRIWITDLDNNTVHMLSESDLPYLPLNLTAASEQIVPINISSRDLGEYINVKVTTERGNIFASETNTLHITEEGGWEVLPYVIDVVIQGSGQGKKRYVIEVIQLDTTGEPTSWNTTVLVSSMGTFAQASIAVPSIGGYRVKVYKWGAADPFFTKDVEVPLFKPIYVDAT